jgi:hypothetical protein
LVNCIAGVFNRLGIALANPPQVTQSSELYPVAS